MMCNMGYPHAALIMAFELTPITQSGDNNKSRANNA